MKVVEDFTKSRKSVINDLHHQQIPAGFTGVIIFYSLDKKFINGYKYKNGQITGTLNLSTDLSNTQATTTTVIKSKSIKPLVLQDPDPDGCDTIIIVVPPTGYSNNVITYSFLPTAVFKLINASPCTSL